MVNPGKPLGSGMCLVLSLFLLVTGQRVSKRRGGLVAIPVDIPTGTKDLDLSYNKLSTIEKNAFANLTSLEILFLGNNHITHLDPKAFEGLNKLLVLDLETNLLHFDYVSYPASVFEPLVSLEVLMMHGQPTDRGLKAAFPEDIFKPLKRLKELRIDLPRDFTFGQIFAEMKNIQSLSVSCSDTSFQVKNETFRAFQTKWITSFTLSCFDIEPGTLEVFKWVKDLSISAYNLEKSLQALRDFQHRNLTHLRLYGSSRPGYSSTCATLSTNNVEFLSNVCVKSLDLSGNNLIHLDTQAFKKFQHPDCLEELYLQGNSLNLGTNLFIFLSLNHFRFLKVLDISSKRTISSTTLVRNDENNLKLFSTLEFPVPQYLRFLNLSSTIGSNDDIASFSVADARNLKVLDLSYSGVRDCNFVVKGLENITVLNITQMDCSRLSSDFLEAFLSLEELVMTSCSLSQGLQASPFVFHPLVRLKILDLSSNGLTRLHQDTFVQLKKLHRLNLANNKFVSIPGSVISLLALSSLDMSNNVISSLSKDTMKFLQFSNQYITNNGSVILRDNPFVCTCETIVFIRWTLASTTTVLKPDLTCLLTNGSEILISDLKSSLKDFEVKCMSHFWLTFSVVFSCLFVFSILVSIVLYRNRIKILYWMKTKMCPPSYDYLSLELRNYQYDAFVAYNHEDAHFACNEMRLFLEETHSFKLCLHHRDFAPGSYILDEIINSINSSRKIILVVSRAFLSSIRCDLEIQLARMRVSAEGVPGCLVIILYEHILPSEMPESLLSIWNEVVFLVWNAELSEQTIFWQRLAAVIES